MRTLGILALVASLAAADRIDNVFRIWDTNRDGILTSEEITDEALFKQVDADGDGRATRKEVAAYLGVKPTPKPEPKADKPKPDKGKGDTKSKSSGKNPQRESKKDPNKSKSVAQPEKMPFTVNERVADFFKRFDLNKNNRIELKEFRGGEDVFRKNDRNRNRTLSKKEVARYIQDQLREAKKRPRPDNFFELFDKNRDKKVTRKEYDGPPRFFKSYDHNKNNTVTEQELNMGPKSAMSMGDPKRVERDGATPRPKKTLPDRYDTDKNGRITLAELKGAESIMARLDNNGDGVLSGAEVR